MEATRVLLTGSTGNMGMEGLKQIHARRDEFHLIILALPSRKERKKLAPYMNDPCVSIIWGDLRNFEDVRKAVSTADIILHVGALVSPQADRQPRQAWEINFGGTKNIVDAIRQRSDADRVKLVYIGTVAQTGNRAAPFHWGRIGDPLVPSVFDHYALSKIAAERYVISSGLPFWVSLRQTGIMHENILAVNDGIGFHMPLDNHLEWVTARDSGRMLLALCSRDLPDNFWQRVYNIGGGASCRLTGVQVLERLFGTLGVDHRSLNDTNWFATRNFHGHWYLDSDRLDELLQFRSESFDDVLERIKKQLPPGMRLLRFLPASWVRRFYMLPTATGQNSPLNWIRKGKEELVSAFLGSEENWRSIPRWEGLSIENDPPHQLLSHGYDESKDEHELDIDDMQHAARYRGGACLSAVMLQGELYDRLEWECAHGHRFTASPFLVLKAGHWCPDCLAAPWNFDEQARNNPFLAQVWYADHSRDEDRVYGKALNT